MKEIRLRDYPPHQNKQFFFVRKATAFMVALFFLALGWSHEVLAQSDDFDDGNDNGWRRHDPLAIVGAKAVFSFPDLSGSGRAFRLQGTVPPIGDAGPARALALVTNIYSDFYAAVDVTAWDNDVNQAFGLVFRADNIGLGTITGYIFNYNPQQASGGRGQLQINRVVGEAGAGTLAAANLTLEAGHRYRFVLTAVGSEFTAKIYDHADLTAPLTGFTASDPEFTKGMAGVFCYYRGNAVTDKVAGRSDATFDNFVVAPLGAPTSVASPGTPHSLPGMPQVVNRSPATRASFYSAAKGITFSATTLTTNRVNTNAIALFLNGADVSSKLAISGTSSNAIVAFNGLQSNTVYEGRVVLEDLSGRKSTNEWTFDTLSEDFLNGASAKVIEAEDYNYDAGKFQDSPPVSGMTAAGALVNGNGTGYFETAGVSGVDYFDYSSQTGGGLLAEYRSSDFVGTQAGSVEAGASGQEVAPQNDVRRGKYAARDLAEYQVRRTEGGEWLNYTRNFAAGDYNVFLRVAARTRQPVLLHRVTSDRTKPDQSTAALGTFQVPNSGLTTVYRFVPLTDASGKLATVRLGGLETLRLTIGGPQEDATQYTMSLNYLLFVPAGATPGVVQVESAPTVTGPYAIDTAAVVGADLSVSVPMGGSSRFYRLRAAGGGSFRITSIAVAAGKILLKFEGSP